MCFSIEISLIIVSVVGRRRQHINRQRHTRKMRPNLFPVFLFFRILWNLRHLQRCFGWNCPRRIPAHQRINTIFLPADFLGNTSVTSLSLSMDVFSKRPSLVIDPLALRSSQNSLTEFSVSKFDFGLQTDFNFLNGINNLEELWISKITNFTAFQYLPPLPSLQKLTVTSCPSELDEIPFPDLSLSN